MRTNENNSIQQSKWSDPEWSVGCGGTEIAFNRNGKTYLYVWNHQKREHAYYCFEDDLFIPDFVFADRY